MSPPKQKLQNRLSDCEARPEARSVSPKDDEEIGPCLRCRTHGCLSIPIQTTLNKTCSPTVWCTAPAHSSSSSGSSVLPFNSANVVHLGRLPKQFSWNPPHLDLWDKATHTETPLVNKTTSFKGTPYFIKPPQTCKNPAGEGVVLLIGGSL